jgi:hypothetical protein
LAAHERQIPSFAALEAQLRQFLGQLMQALLVLLEGLIVFPWQARQLPLFRKVLAGQFRHVPFS